MESNISKTSRTASTPFAAYLSTTGSLELIGSEISVSDEGSRIVNFIFNDPEQRLLEFRQEFLSGARVPAMKFAQELRNLKTMVARKLGGGL